MQKRIEYASRTIHGLLALAVVALMSTACGDAADFELAESSSRVAGVSSEPPGAPQTPTSPTGPTCREANPQNCQQAENMEVQPPPPPPGYACSVTIELESAVVTQDQSGALGIDSEGLMEISIDAEAGQGTVTYPSSGYTLMDLGEERTIDANLATYYLRPREVKEVEVCGHVLEREEGTFQLNGDEDVGDACIKLNLSCRKMRHLTEWDESVEIPLCKNSNFDDLGNCQEFNGAVELTYNVSYADEDGDGFEEPDDATPDFEDEACRGQKGQAVILFSEMGTSNLNDVVGVIGMGIDSMTSGYDFVAILTDPLKVAGFSLRGDSIAQADLHDMPTLENLSAAMRTITGLGYDITLYYLGHGGADSFGEAFFTSADADGFIDETELRAELDPLNNGTCAWPLKMTHSQACYQHEMSDAWHAIGTRASAFPPEVSFYPQESNELAREWNLNQRFGDAVAASPSPFVRDLNATAIDVWANVNAIFDFDADGCSGVSVLDENDCAERFFTTDGPTSVSFELNGRSDYDPSISGRENMDAGSNWVLVGDDQVRKLDVLSW